MESASPELSNTSGTTMAVMTVQKRSVSLDADVATAIEQAAEAEGVAFSTWLNQAAKRELLRRDGLAAIEEWEAEAGALTREEIAAGEALLDRLLERPA